MNVFDEIPGAAALTATFMLAALGTTGALGDNDKRCNDKTLRGDYGGQLQGMAPSPTGPLQSIIGVVMRSYDGRGNFQQVDNVNGSLSGTAHDRPGAGTYEVFADCTAVSYIQPDPNNPGLIIEEKMVIVNNGDEILSVTTAPPPVRVTAVSKRVKKH